MSIVKAMRNLRARSRRWLQGGRAIGAGLGLAAAVLTAPLAHAEFQNGSFEQDWAGWTVESLQIPAHISPFPPTKFEDLGTLLWTAANPGVSAVVGSGIVANTDNNLTTPLFGNKSARVGDGQTSYRGASIRQTAKMTVADIDPADGKVHIRFAIAPVLEAPSHPADQQPYFFVEVKNHSKGTQLFHTFNFANQTGVAWQSAVGGYQFTEWQAVDIAPGNGVLDVGDDVEVIIVSGGCGQGGHGARVYVDSGQGLNSLPGPFVTATAPEYVVASDAGADMPTVSPPAGQRTVTYNYHYSNGGDEPMTGSQIIIRSPQDQDVRNASGQQTAGQHNLRVDLSSLPGGCSITQTITPPPAHADGSLGPIDVVTCSVGTLNPGNAGDLQLKWIVPSNVRGPTVNHGNYAIRSDNSPKLLGPLVKSTVTTLKLADLKATVANPDSSLTCGSATTYTVTLENGGPDPAPPGVVINNPVPAGLTVNSWTCAATGGALACPAVSGAGSIGSPATTTTAWAMGDKLTYTVQATVDACAGGAKLITYPVTLALPVDPTIVDPDSTNNTHANVLNAGPALQPLTVDTAGNGGGTVTSVLPGIVCTKPAPGTQCSDTKSFPAGSQVALYANAPAGSIFSGWSGGVCSGTVSPCFVTMSQARSVTANFSVPLDVTINVTGPGGTATPGNGTVVPVMPGGTTSITVQPNGGFAPVFGGNCPVGSYVGNIYTTGAVTGSCTVDITFTNSNVFTATPNAPANGSIVGGPKTVASGGSATWKVTPNSNFTPNLTPSGTCPAGTWNSDNTEYTVSNITVDCSVNFSFVPSVTVTGSVSGASPGPGSITAGASQTLAGGSSAVFTLSRPGTVDPASTCVGGSFDAAGTTYTVPNVVANCDMVFSFAALPPSVASIPTLSEWGMIILSGLMVLFMVGMRRRQML